MFGRSVGVFAAAAVLMLSAISLGATYSGGSGTDADPYQISTTADWQTLINTSIDWNKNFILTNDLDFNGGTISPVGTYANPFVGSFDGQGYVIRNFVINLPTTEHVGLFGCIYTNKSIQNIGVENIDVTGKSSVGGLVGTSTCSMISCYSTGVVRGTYAGGIVGQNKDGSITACYSTCSVTGTHSVGGLVGSSKTGSISYCYSTGQVIGSFDVGGLLGNRGFSSVTNCFWDTETSGQAGSMGGTGKLTSEMKTLSTFTEAGWDFIEESTNGTHDFWGIHDNEYPCFAEKSWTLSGEGTSSNPYVITKISDLGRIWLKPSACYRMNADIDLTGISWSMPVVPVFTGNFNGHGHSISHLTINLPGYINLGFFGYVKGENQIQNLRLNDVSITGYSNVGGLVGYNDSYAIIACYVTGSVDGTYHSYAAVGGLVGSNISGKVISCYVDGLVSGTGGAVGGLVGVNSSGMIISSYAKGAVSGSSSVGGLAGRNYLGRIASCYAAGTVNGKYDYIGGFVGNSEGTMTACFWDTELSGLSRGTGSGEDAGAIGKATGQMRNIHIYKDAGWSIMQGAKTTGDWIFAENEYPKLGWEVHPMIIVPNLKGLAESEAESLLISQGFCVAETYSVYDTSVSAGLVSGTYPQSGTQVYAGLTPIHVLRARETKYSGGNGVTESYRITNIGDLLDLKNSSADWKYQFLLTEDINLEDGVFSQALIAPNKKNSFSGIFNGNGHVIRNLSIYYTAIDDYGGLFGAISSSGQITNLGLENIRIVGQSYGSVIGMLTGYNSGSLNDCFASGFACGIGNSTFLGGLVGYNQKGTIMRCYSKGPISGAVTTFSECYIGGLVGYNDTSSSVIHSYAIGSANGGRCVGGLVGSNSGLIKTCYSNSLVSGIPCIGGLVGNNNGTIITSYSSGQIINRDVFPHGEGGFIGSNVGVAISCFWDIQTSGKDTGGAGYDIVGVTGKTTEEMKTLSTYTAAGWDFAGENENGFHEYWQFTADDYPRLTIYQWHLSGDGTSVAPYIIADASDLGQIWLRPSGCYCLGGNLDLSGISWSTVISPTFAGTFDGQNFVISNLMINQSHNENVGLFGEIKPNSKIMNLGLANVNVVGFNSVGAFAGRIDSSAISNCYSTGSIEAVQQSFSYVGGMIGICNSSSIVNSYSICSVIGTVNEHSGAGGLIGQCSSSNISNCHTSGSVTGYYNVGGLIGASNSGSINQSYSTSSVVGRYYAGGLVGTSSSLVLSCYADNPVRGTQRAIGGLIGETSGGKISSCYAKGVVSGNEDVGGLVGQSNCSIMYSFASGAVSGGSSVGGLVGENWNLIDSCYAMGAVTATDYVGGLVGYGNSGKLTYCYSVGPVYGIRSNVGGLSGFRYFSETTPVACFWDVETSGTTVGVGGGVPAEVAGKATVEMQTRSTFDSAGWDFEKVWTSCEGTGYPRLLNLIPSADLVCPDGVDAKDLDYFAQRWLMPECGVSNDYCDRADIDKSSVVDMADFVFIAEQWLLSESIVFPPPSIEAPVAWWKMDGISGAIVSDSISGYDGHTLNVADNLWVTGQRNNAIKLDGTNDYVDVPGYEGITGTASRTCMAWIKANSAGKEQVILSWGNGVNGQKWMCRLQADGKLAVGVWGGYIYGSVSVADGQWHHVAAVLADDGSPSVDEIKLYVDGIGQAVTYNTTQAIDTAISQNVQIGSVHNGTAQVSFFNGLIDEVRIYDAVLTGEQILRVAME